MANIIKEQVVSVLQDLLQSAEYGDNILLTDEELWALRIAIAMLKNENFIDIIGGNKINDGAE